jgi:hypothetical protein
VVGWAGTIRLAVVVVVARNVVLVVAGYRALLVVLVVAGAAVVSVVGAEAVTDVVEGGGRKWAIRPTNTTADAVPATSRDRWDRCGMPPRIDDEPGRPLCAG